MAKYRNRRVTIDGVTFDSQAEAGRYLELREQEARGEISRLEIHPPYRIKVRMPDTGEYVLLCRYIADFSYVRGTSHVVEDVKGGILTPVYRLKKKLLAAGGVLVAEHFVGRKGRHD